MANISEAASEFRANLEDWVTYVVPGVLVLLTALGVMWLACEEAQRTALRNALRQWFSPALSRMGQFWTGALAVAVVLVLCYAVGALLHTLDSTVGPKWTRHADTAAHDSPATFQNLSASAQEHLGWEGNQNWDKATRKERRGLHNLAQALLVLRARHVHAYALHHGALADFHGHVAWVVLLAGVVLPGAAWHSAWQWWSASVVGLILLLEWLWFARVRGAPTRHDEGPEAEAECIQKRAKEWLSQHWPVLVLALCLLIVFVVATLRTAGENGSWLGLILIPSVSVIAFLGLKRRQFSIFTMRVHYVWNGAFLVLKTPPQRGCGPTEKNGRDDAQS